MSVFELEPKKNRGCFPVNIRGLSTRSIRESSLANLLRDTAVSFKGRLSRSDRQILKTAVSVESEYYQDDESISTEEFDAYSRQMAEKEDDECSFPSV